MSFKHRLGLKARDTVTGFEGIIRYRVEYLTGCIQYGLQPPIDKEGKVPEAIQFDENSIEVLGEGVMLTEEGEVVEVGEKKPHKKKAVEKLGGPQKSAKKRD